METLNDMVAYFYSNGDLNLMLTKVLCFVLVLLFLATIISVLRRLRF